MKRKDIENLSTILVAIERLERKPEATIEHAERLDTLYTALKSQAKSVIEIQHLEETSNAVSN